MKEKEFYEKQISSELKFDGKIIHVYHDEIEQNGGRRTHREVIRHNGSVCVVPVNDKNEVICVKQYRYPFASTMIEIPAGKLDGKNEDHRKAAERELREETGLTCKNLKFIGDYYPSPAILDEVIHMYMATELTQGDTDMDEGEIIEPFKFPIKELVEMIMDGKICDGKTQIAVLKAYNILSGFNCAPTE